MRTLTALLTIALLASTVQAQDKRKQLLDGVAQLAKDIERLQVSQALTPDELAYAKAFKEAKSKDVWLVVYVGVPVRSIDKTVGVRLASLNEDSSQRIVTCKPDIGRGDAWPPQVETERLQQHMGILPIMAKGGQPSALPFAPNSSFLRPGEVAATADADERWPVGLSFLNDMEPYTSATQTQITFRRWSGYIGSQPRGVLELKWRVPGHLVGVHGWSSRLYRSKAIKAKVFLVRQDPADGSSAVTWGRNYPDSAVFADVLRNEDGKVFEVRVAEKHAGTWSRYVAFRDATARPIGYHPPTRRQCAECHNQAGVSAYGGAAIPGADTILSDPLPIVERGETVQGGYGVNLGN